MRWLYIIDFACHEYRVSASYSRDRKLSRNRIHSNPLTEGSLLSPRHILNMCYHGVSFLAILEVFWQEEFHIINKLQSD